MDINQHYPLNAPQGVSETIDGVDACGALCDADMMAVSFAGACRSSRGLWNQICS